MKKLTLTDDSGTWLEILPSEYDTYVTVARDDDQEDDERVFCLSREDAAALVSDLVSWLARPQPKDGGTP